MTSTFKGLSSKYKATLVEVAPGLMLRILYLFAIVLGSAQNDLDLQSEQVYLVGIYCILYTVYCLLLTAYCILPTGNCDPRHCLV